MKTLAMAVSLFGAVFALAGQAHAQQASQYPLDTVPEKLPYATAYGAPISLARAQSLIQAAMAEANKRGWPVNIAVVDSGANLVAFARMDGAQLASIAISEHKARTAVKYRRPTKVFEEALQKQDMKYLLALDDIMTSRGGIPLVDHDRIIGAIGCSGGTGSQDEVVCMAGVAALNR